MVAFNLLRDRCPCTRLAGLGLPVIVFHGSPTHMLNMCAMELIAGGSSRATAVRATWVDDSYGTSSGTGGRLEYESYSTHIRIEVTESVPRRAVISLLRLECRTKSLDALHCTNTTNPSPDRRLVVLWGGERQLAQVQHAVVDLSTSPLSQATVIILWPRLAGVSCQLQSCGMMVNCARALLSSSSSAAAAAGPMLRCSRSTAEPLANPRPLQPRRLLIPLMQQLLAEMASATSSPASLEALIREMATCIRGIPPRALCEALMEAVEESSCAEIHHRKGPRLRASDADAFKHQIAMMCVQLDCECLATYQSCSEPYHAFLLRLALALRGANYG
jgi:hypothetical protein